MTDFRNIAAAVAVSAAAAGGITHYVGKPAPTETKTIVVQKGDVMSKSERRAAEQSWGDLAQTEVDALSAQLKKMPSRQVIVFCESEPRCGDMALDFENALETAKWKVDVQRPAWDDTRGIGATSPDLVDAIKAATNGRLPVVLIQKNQQADAITIGAKPGK